MKNEEIERRSSIACQNACKCLSQVDRDTHPPMVRVATRIRILDTLRHDLILLAEQGGEP